MKNKIILLILVFITLASCSEKIPKQNDILITEIETEKDDLVPGAYEAIQLADIYEGKIAYLAQSTAADRSRNILFSDLSGEIEMGAIRFSRGEEIHDIHLFQGGVLFAVTHIEEELDCIHYHRKNGSQTMFYTAPAQGNKIRFFTMGDNAYFIYSIADGQEPIRTVIAKITDNNFDITNERYEVFDRFEGKVISLPQITRGNITALLVEQDGEKSFRIYDKDGYNSSIDVSEEIDSFFCGKEGIFFTSREDAEIEDLNLLWGVLPYENDSIQGDTDGIFVIQDNSGDIYAVSLTGTNTSMTMLDYFRQIPDSGTQEEKTIILKQDLEKGAVQFQGGKNIYILDLK